uniref:Uncharacterized protein n=1 Tax=Setaria italica TaxID=4555 RepID=K3Y4F9_SETIT
MYTCSILIHTCKFFQCFLAIVLFLLLLLTIVPLYPC